MSQKYDRKYLLKKIWVWIISASFILASCEPKNLPVPNEQDILFEVYYINFAWGKQHNGFLVDRTGNIRIFKNPVKWNFSAGNGELTEKQMAENIALTTLSSKNIPIDEVKGYASKIYNINQKKLSKPVNQGADQGESVILTYLYNSETEIYRQVLLSQKGDWNSENEDKSAKTVCSWLSGIAESL